MTLSRTWFLIFIQTIVSSEFIGSLVGPKYFINNAPTSQPLLFYQDFDSDLHVVNNASLIVKKKKPTTADADHGQHELSVGSHDYRIPSDVGMSYHYKRKKRPPLVEGYQLSGQNDHHSVVVYKPTVNPSIFASVNNHKPWNDYFKKKTTVQNIKTYTQKPWTKKPYPSSSPMSSDRLPDVSYQRFIINNHKNFGNRIRYKPPTTAKPHLESFTAVSIIDKVQKDQVLDISGDRLKQPDTITSPEVTVLDSPSIQTTVKHDKLVVIQKRFEPQPDVSTRSGAEVFIVTSKPLVTHSDRIKVKPSKGNAVPGSHASNPWSNIPIPSKPSWTPSRPSKGSAASSSTSQGVPSMFPAMPFMPFLTSLISPLLKKPLTPETVNTGMQAELRSGSNMDDMVIFCKTCLENLQTIKKFTREQPSWWESVIGQSSGAEVMTR